MLNSPTQDSDLTNQSAITRQFSSQSSILGWDVGGAHLKAVLIESESGHVKVLQVIQLPCPLWRGVDTLVEAVQNILSQLQAQFHIVPHHHAVTMTGELADIFADRNSGVLEIADIMSQLLPGRVRFYAGKSGFVAIADVAFNTSHIASANWHASASLVARESGQGLFVDIGSTTSDLALFANHVPQVRGYSDAERMRYEELVYTGVVRTPLMAIASRISFDGEWVTLAAEHFATTADIYRLTGELDAAADLADTADGKGKSIEESARRLARMIGHDAGDAGILQWICLAQALRHSQLHLLLQAASRALSRQLVKPDAPLVGAGAGSFLVHHLANQLQRPYVDASSLIRGNDDALRAAAAVCLPAYAVAVLSTDERSTIESLV